MARIPFRALGRPLSGKNGRFHGRGVLAPVISGSLPNTPPEPEPEPNVTPELIAALEPEPVAPTQWEPTWTKAQLLVATQTLGLAMTPANSKAEIIAALTAAG
jgi:hypothetical protein